MLKLKALTLSSILNSISAVFGFMISMKGLVGGKRSFKNPFLELPPCLLYGIEDSFNFDALRSLCREAVNYLKSTYRAESRSST